MKQRHIVGELQNINATILSLILSLKHVKGGQPEREKIRKQIALLRTQYKRLSKKAVRL